MQRNDQYQGWRVYISIQPTHDNREIARQVLASIFGEEVGYSVDNQAEPGREICVYMDYDESRHTFVKTPEEYKDLLLTCWQRLAIVKVIGIGYTTPATRTLPKLNSRAIATPFQITSSEYESQGNYQENFDPLKDQTLTIQELQVRGLSPNSIIEAKVAYLIQKGNKTDADRYQIAWDDQLKAQAKDDMTRLFLRIAQYDASFQDGIVVSQKFLEGVIRIYHGKSELTSRNSSAYEELQWKQYELIYQCLRTLALDIAPTSELADAMSMLGSDRPKVNLNKESPLYKLFLEVKDPKKLRESRHLLVVYQEPLYRAEAVEVMPQNQQNDVLPGVFTTDDSARVECETTGNESLPALSETLPEMNHSTSNGIHDKESDLLPITDNVPKMEPQKSPAPVREELVQSHTQAWDEQAKSAAELIVPLFTPPVTEARSTAEVNAPQPIVDTDTHKGLEKQLKQPEPEITQLSSNNRNRGSAPLPAVGSLETEQQNSYAPHMESVSSSLYQASVGEENERRDSTRSSSSTLLSSIALSGEAPISLPTEERQQKFVDILRELETEIIGKDGNKKWKTAYFGGVDRQIKNGEGKDDTYAHITATMDTILNRITQARLLSANSPPDQKNEICRIALVDIHASLRTASQQNNKWQAKFFGRKEETKNFYKDWNERLNLDLLESVTHTI